MLIVRLLREVYEGKYCRRVKDTKTGDNFYKLTRASDRPSIITFQMFTSIKCNDKVVN